MKALLHTLSFLILFTFFFAPGLVRAQDDPNDNQGVSFQAFYDQLGDQGTWVQTDDYGYVFQPNVQDADWAPYTDGYWVDSDDGWTWVSNEPWGWATYHYGRWANIDGMGWVWVPGYRWAPAWVSWRYGGGYAGWAPLPPETFEGAEYGDAGTDFSVGFHFGSDVDVSFDIGPGCYNFVPVEYLGERDYRRHYEHRDRNFVIINNTRNVTNININGDRRGGRNGGFRGVSVGGPSLTEVNAHSRQHVQRVNLTASNQAGRSTVQGNSLAVFAPRVNPATAQQAKPTRVGQTINQPKFNRGNSITNPLAVSANVRPQAPNAEAIQAAQKAEAQAPATAKIATDKTPQHAHFNKPLTSMTPVGEAPRTAAPQNGVQPAATFNSNVNPPSATGEQPEKKKHNGAAAPFTGESANPAATPQPNTVNPQPAATLNSNVNPPSATGEQPEKKHHQGQSNAANAPFTGESANPAATPQPNTVNPKPAATFNSNVNPPSATGEQPEKKHHQGQGAGDNVQPSNTSQVESHQQQQLQQQQAQEQARKQQAAAEEQKQALQHQQAEAQQSQQVHQQQAQEEHQRQAQAERESHQQQQQQPQVQQHQQPQETHQSAPAPHPQPQAQAQPQHQQQQAPHPAPQSGGNGGGKDDKKDKDKNGQ